MRSRSRSSHTPGALFKYLYHGWGSNDIRELRKFSTQLDMLIEKPRFKGKVHIGADGGTMHGGWLRSVSLPGYTLMAFFFFHFPPCFTWGKQGGKCLWPKAVRGWRLGGGTLGRVDIIANFHVPHHLSGLMHLLYLCLVDLSSQKSFIWMLKMLKNDIHTHIYIYA